MDPGRREYERWVAEYGGELYRYARGLVGESGRGGEGGGAEDLLQDTFVEAWKSRGSLRQPGQARAWLFQIMRHRYVRMVRKKRVERGAVAWEAGGAEEDGGVMGEPEAGGEAVLDGLARRDELDASLARLSPEIRRTFLMVFLEQLTCRETAAELGIPVGTVLSRLDAARRKLRAFMTRGETRAGSPGAVGGAAGVQGSACAGGGAGAGGVAGVGAVGGVGGNGRGPGVGGVGGVGGAGESRAGGAGTRAVTPETGRTP